MDLYDTLGVAKDATKAAIKKAFRQRARETHPDAGGEPEKFHAVELAHRILTDDARRSEYDATWRVDDTVDTIDAQALSIIGGLVERALADDRAIYVDLAERLRKSIRDDIDQAEQSRAEADVYLERIEKVRAKFRGGKGAKLVDGMIARRIEQTKAGMAALRQQIAIRERALALIEDLAFDADEDARNPPWMVDEEYLRKMAEMQRMQNFTNFGFR